MKHFFAGRSQRTTVSSNRLLFSPILPQSVSEHVKYSVQIADVVQGDGNSSPENVGVDGKKGTEATTAISSEIGLQTGP